MAFFNSQPESSLPIFREFYTHYNYNHMKYCTLTIYAGIDSWIYLLEDFESFDKKTKYISSE